MLFSNRDLILLTLLILILLIFRLKVLGKFGQNNKMVDFTSKFPFRDLKSACFKYGLSFRAFCE